VFAILKDDATVFMNGSFEKPTDPKHVALLMPVIHRSGINDETLEAFPVAAAKKASSRSEWECKVVNDAERGVKAHMVAVRMKLASSSTLPECEAAVLAAELELKEASAALDAAEAKMSNLAAESEAAQQPAAEVASEVERAQADLDNANSFLAKFRDGPLAAFRSLDGQLARQLLERAPRERTIRGSACPPPAERDRAITYHVP